MPNFNAMLSTPAGEGRAPVALPAGDYPSVVMKWSPGESSNKKTPFVEFELRPVAFPEEVDPSEVEGIDLSKKVLRCTFYLSEDAKYRLDGALREACGLDISGKSYLEVLPESIGTNVLAVVSRREVTDQQSGEVTGWRNEVRDMKKLP